MRKEGGGVYFHMCAQTIYLVICGSAFYVVAVEANAFQKSDFRQGFGGCAQFYKGAA